VFFALLETPAILVMGAAVLPIVLTNLPPIIASNQLVRGEPP